MQYNHWVNNFISLKLKDCELRKPSTIRIKANGGQERINTVIVTDKDSESGYRKTE